MSSKLVITAAAVLALAASGNAWARGGSAGGHGGVGSGAAGHGGVGSGAAGHGGAESGAAGHGGSGGHGGFGRAGFFGAAFAQAGRFSTPGRLNGLFAYGQGRDGRAFGDGRLGAPIGEDRFAAHFGGLAGRPSQFGAAVRPGLNRVARGPEIENNGGPPGAGETEPVMDASDQGGVCAGPGVVRPPAGANMPMVIYGSASPCADAVSPGGPGVYYLK